MASIAKNILLDQLAACQNDPSWYVPLSIALNGLSAVQADWHALGQGHSIRGIINHLSFWNERWLQRFRGTNISSEVVENDMTFNYQDQPFDEWHWQCSVARINTILSDWRKAVGECTEEKLIQSVPHVEFDAPWWAVISNLITHNVYHIGQIVYIRKLQGSWDDSMGL